MRIVSTLIATSLALIGTASAKRTPVIFRFKVLDETLRGCSNFTLNFTTKGTTPPYRLTSFPDDNEVFTWDIKEGEYEKTNFGGSIDLALPYRTFKNTGISETQRIVFVMSDSANGFGSGGVSEIMTVQSNANTNNECTYPPNAFQWGAAPGLAAMRNGGLKACGTLSAYWGKQHMGNDKPDPSGEVTWLGVVPNTEVWFPDGNTVNDNFTMSVNLQTGTTLMMAAWDGTGVSGGSLGPVTVASGTSQCMQNQEVIPKDTAPLDWNAYIAEYAPANGGKTGMSSATKIGIGVGVAVGVLLLLILLGVIFWLRRKNRLETRKPAIIDMVDDDDLMSNNQGLDASHIPTPYIATRYNAPTRASTDMSASDGYPPMLSPLMGGHNQYHGSEGNRSSFVSSSSFNPGIAMTSMAAASPATLSAAQAALIAKGGAQPPSEPTFTYHQDAAGPSAPPPDNIDVPPTYNPAWSEPGGSSSGPSAAAMQAALPEKGRY